MFVDHASQTVPIVNPQTGDVYQEVIFVAVLGFGNYTYAEATWEGDLASWIVSHTHTNVIATTSKTETLYSQPKRLKWMP